MNKAIEHLINEFNGMRKNITSRSQAVHHWTFQSSVQGIRQTPETIQQAYDICYGHGCEFEWTTE